MPEPSASDPADQIGAKAALLDGEVFLEGVERAGEGLEGLRWLE